MATRSTTKGIVPVLRTEAAGFDAAFEKLVRRRDDGAEDVSRTVRRIIDRVRDGGDEELLACVKKYDGASVDVLEVQPREMDYAGDAIDPADRAALGKAAMRVREFHRKRIPSSWEVREEGGGSFGHRVRPLARVGIYVPGGTAIYPSTVIMNAIPASVVEVPEIIMATPPSADGTIRPEVLMAAKVAGVHRIFKMGVPTRSQRWPLVPRACRASTRSWDRGTSTWRRRSACSSATSTSTARPGRPK